MSIVSPESITEAVRQDSSGESDVFTAPSPSGESAQEASQGGTGCLISSVGSRGALQIKIARGTAFFLNFAWLIVPGIFIVERLDAGESITWQSALLFMGAVYLLSLPFPVVAGVFAWSLRRRKKKTALVSFAVLVIFLIVSAVTSAMSDSGYDPLSIAVDVVVVCLLLQGILGVHKPNAEFRGISGTPY